MASLLGKRQHQQLAPMSAMPMGPPPMMFAPMPMDMSGMDAATASVATSSAAAPAGTAVESTVDPAVEDRVGWRCQVFIFCYVLPSMFECFKTVCEEAVICSLFDHRRCIVPACLIVCALLHQVVVCAADHLTWLGFRWRVPVCRP
jgi:hypothetical protein